MISALAFFDFSLLGDAGTPIAILLGFKVPVPSSGTDLRSVSSGNLRLLSVGSGHSL